jgi:hypothetical protein
MSEYIKDITEDQKDSRKNGDVQILEAGEKDPKPQLPKEKVGNQSKEYYAN